MNQRSSRSHAIFTITVEQRRVAPQHERTPYGDESGDEDDGAADEYLCAKMHLVDLAGVPAKENRSVITSNSLTGISRGTCSCTIQKTGAVLNLLTVYGKVDSILSW